MNNSWYTPVMRIVGSWDGWKLWRDSSFPFWSPPPPRRLLLSLSKMNLSRHETICEFVIKTTTPIVVNLPTKTTKQSSIRCYIIWRGDSSFDICEGSRSELSWSGRTTAETRHETWVGVREAVQSVQHMVDLQPHRLTSDVCPFRFNRKGVSMQFRASAELRHS